MRINIVLAHWVRIRIEIKRWIRIGIEINADPQQYFVNKKDRETRNL
jgi:hypothetical protein